MPMNPENIPRKKMFPDIEFRTTRTNKEPKIKKQYPKHSREVQDPKLETLGNSSLKSLSLQDRLQLFCRLFETYGTDLSRRNIAEVNEVLGASVTSDELSRKAWDDKYKAYKEEEKHIDYNSPPPPEKKSMMEIKKPLPFSKFNKVDKPNPEIIK